MARRTAKGMVKRTVDRTAKSLEGLLAGECRHGRDPGFDIVVESWSRTGQIQGNDERHVAYLNYGNERGIYKGDKSRCSRN